MQKSEFSEKFYEILIDHLLLNNGYQIFILSQYKESKLGYDALINNMKNRYGTKCGIRGFALQYKIVEEYKKPPNILENFKFYLHPTHQYRQHNKLCKLNRGLKFFAAYCVPKFVTMKDLYSNFNSGNLLLNSAFIVPHMPICDNNSHYITFGSTSAHQHSREQIGCVIKNLAQILEEQNDEPLLTPEEFVTILKEFRSEFFENEIERTRRYNYNNSFLIAFRIM